MLHLCRLGWVPATVVIVALTVSTIYSGHLILRLYNAVPNAVLFGDIGEAAAGNRVCTSIFSCFAIHTTQIYMAVLSMLKPQAFLLPDQAWRALL